jgi:hypothetical protein
MARQTASDRRRVVVGLAVRGARSLLGELLPPCYAVTTR